MLTELLPEQLGSVLRKPGAVLVDVRGEEEWRQGHIQGAVLLPLMVLPFKIHEVVPAKDVPVVVYCRSGNRSAHAAHALLQMGYTNVYNLEGGYVAYQNASA